MPAYGNKLILFVSILPSLALPGLALAQTTTPGAADGEEGEIIVTAQKRAQNINDVGSSITALNADQLSQQRIVSAADLAAIVPGFSANETGNGRTIFTMRGIGFPDTSLQSLPSVSVYVDEVALPYPSMVLGAGIDLERVEVLKGPQGTYYGQNATGGAVNYIAAKPTSGFGAGLELGYGRFDTFEAAGFVSGPLSSTLNARVAGKIVNGGPWQRSVSRDDRNGRSDQIMGRFLLDWEPVGGALFRLSVNGWRDRSETQAGQVAEKYGGDVPAFLKPEVAAFPVSQDPRSADWDADKSLKRDSDFLQISLRGEIDVGDWAQFTSISAYSRLNYYAPTDLDGTPFRVYFSTYDGRIRSISQEARLSGVIDGRLNWMVGGNYLNDKIREYMFGQSPRHSRANAAGRNWQDFGIPNTGDLESWAAFANADYDLTDHLSLTLGARYTWSRHDFTGCTVSGTDNQLGLAFTTIINTNRAANGQGPLATPIQSGECITQGPPPTFTPGLVSGGFSEDSISWRAGLNWKTAGGMLLYGNISRGFKSGSFPAVSASSYAQLAPVVQEQVTAYEAGIKASTIDRSAQINAAAFYYDYKNKQLLATFFDPVFNRISRLANIPKSEVYGFEVNAVLKPSERLRFDIGASYTHARVRRFVAINTVGVLTDYAGLPFNFTPPLNLNAGFTYNAPLSENLDLSFGASMAYRDKTSADLGGIDARYKIDDYYLVDGHVGIESKDKRWSGQIWAKNIFSSYYWSNVNLFDNVIRNTGKPATYGVSVGFRW